MSHGKQFTLYSHKGGPNPWKVVFLLNELGLSYESINAEKNELKSPEYLKINPNGRVPAIVDHKNGDLIVWESGAILLYMAEKYDVERRYFATSDADKAPPAKGTEAPSAAPYFGQAFWFLSHHQEKIPSAIEQYQKEVRRVLGVLESVLSNHEWLVAGKTTISDISFSTWNVVVDNLLEPGFDFEKEFPATYSWHQRILVVPGVKAGFELKKQLASS
ncbi:Glutathione S-transferase 2 [Steccherinum ochraceum]|uniref:Glutathione S-transferase 2 n=1 Tax=Steccherinum ochraceum TaxID=92696 RepID=A0A4R0RCJ7_9APHY|nr:Glutathione S-transferase 2 [Steccherinum ochraceum]